MSMTRGCSIGALLFCLAVDGQAVPIDNTESVIGTIAPFGSVGFATYGQTILDLQGPATRLNSFSLYLSKRQSGSGPLNLRGYVATWDGEKAHEILYESDTRTMNASGVLQEFTFETGGLDLKAGANLVFFLSISNLELQAPSTFGMPYTGDTLSGAFVAQGNPDFDELLTKEWADFTSSNIDVAFKASLVPLPSTLPLLLLGLSAVGMMRLIDRTVTS